MMMKNIVMTISERDGYTMASSFVFDYCRLQNHIHNQRSITGRFPSRKENHRLILVTWVYAGLLDALCVHMLHFYRLVYWYMKKLA